MTWNSGPMLTGRGAQFISTNAYPEPVVIYDVDLEGDVDVDHDEGSCGDDLG